MSVLTLPNPRLIQRLFHDYYEAAPRQQEAYISSHWAYYSDQFKVELDEEGRIRALLGSGFGGMATRNPVEPLFVSVGHLSYLLQLPQRREILALMRAARPVCRAMGFFLSFDAFKQLCALALIRQWMSPAMSRRRLSVVVIGDGYGFLSAMVKTLYPTAMVALVDIGKTLLFQSVYCQRAHPAARHEGITSATRAEDVRASEHDFLYCPTEHLEALRGLRVDLAISIAAMQEMNAATVARYFRFLRDRLHEEHLFYCCSRARKTLRGGEVAVFDEYPWVPSDRHLVDEPCPWYRYACSFRTTGPGPRVWGLRVPFINYFGGQMRHRLSILATSSSVERARASAPALERASGAAPGTPR